MITKLLLNKCLRDGTQPKEAGPIDDKKMIQLLEYAANSGKYAAVDAWNLRVKYQTGLRTSEVAKLTFEQFSQDADGHFFTTEKIHDGWHASKKLARPMEVHRVPLTFVIELNQEKLRRIAARTMPIGPTGLSHTVTQGWNAARLLKLVHAAAVHYKWDDKLDWVLHSLRHGLAVSAATGKTGQAAHAAVAERTGQSSSASTARYSKSETQRLKDMGKNAQATAIVQQNMQQLQHCE